MNSLHGIGTMLLLLVIGNVQAQSLTPKEAQDMAQQLYKLELLSERGRDTLQKKIAAHQLSRPMDEATGRPERSTVLSKAQLIHFLEQAFMADFCWRTGLLKQQGETTGELPPNELAELPPPLEAPTTAEEEATPNSPQGITLYPRSITPEQCQWIHPKRSVVGADSRKTLQDLLTVGLIDSVVYETTQEVLTEQSQLLEMELLHRLYQQMGRVQDQREDQAAALAFAEQLYQVKLLSKSDWEQYKATAQSQPLTPYDLLTTCQQTQQFQIEDFSDDPVEFYKELMEAVLEGLPNLTYQALEVKLSYNEDYLEMGFNMPRFVHLSFQANGQLYAYRFYDGSYDATGIKTARSHPINQDFYQGINKYLIDQGSSQRLHYIRTADNSIPEGQESSFVLALLEEHQAKVLQAQQQLSVAKMENYSQQFTTAHIQQALKDYETIGLLDQLWASAREQGKTAVAMAKIEQYSDVLDCFSGLLVKFDWQNAYLPDHYKRLTNKLSAGSQGIFQPQNILDEVVEKEGKKVRKYGFELNRQSYKTTLKEVSGRLDIRFLELIATAMEEQGLDGCWHYCRLEERLGALYEKEVRGFIFLTTKQHTFLQEKQPSLFLD